MTGPATAPGLIHFADTGEARSFGHGDACVIPAGFIGRFEVLEPLRKRYGMIDAPAGSAA